MSEHSAEIDAPGIVYIDAPLPATVLAKAYRMDAEWERRQRDASLVQTAGECLDCYSGEGVCADCPAAPEARVTPPATTDRGCTTLLPLLGLAFVALSAWGAYSHHLQPWQWIGFGVLAAFALVCVGCCANDGTRERLDSLAPRLTGYRKDVAS